MDRLQRLRYQRGFTIVELLIVIVVIAILAAITIVAYNGIQARAQKTVVQSDVTNGIEKIELYKAGNDTYPNSVTDCPTPASTNICFTPSGSNTIRYNAYTTATNPYHQLLQPSYEIGVMGNDQFYYRSNAERTSGNEFLQYADFAPYIDKYGLKKYQLSFDIKSANTSSQSNTNIYFQNGSSAKYSFGVSVPVTTSYVHQTVTFTPTNATATDTKAVLAFYGIYGTGNIPSVKEVTFQLAQ